MIEIDVQLTFHEYLKASNKFLFKRFRGGIIFICLWLLLALLENIFTAPNKIVWQGYLFPLAIIVLLPTLIYYSAKKQWSLKPSIGELRHYILNDDELQISSSSIFVKHQWSNFTKLVETKHYILLMLNDVEMLVFPHSCFQNETAMNTFKAFVFSHLTGTKAASIKKSKRQMQFIIIIVWLLIIAVVFLMNWKWNK